MKVRTVICDDDKNSNYIISEYIKKIDIPEIKLIGVVKNGTNLIKFCKENKPDLILLDIKMPIINGIEAAKIILGFLPDVLIILITAYSEYSLEAFEIHAIDYILKPVSIERLEKSLKYVINKLNNTSKNKNLTISTKKNLYSIKQDELLFAERSGRKTIIHTPNKTVEVYESLKKLEGKLNKDMFIRTHNSFLVNKSAISKIERHRNGIGKIFIKDYDKQAYISRKNKLKFANIERFIKE